MSRERAADARGQTGSTSSVDHHAPTASEDLLIDVTGRSPARSESSQSVGLARRAAHHRPANGCWSCATLS